MFHVGQKVVCVDDKPHRGKTWRGTIPPKSGEIYTIAEVGLRAHYGSHLCLALIELPGWVYAQHRFRPIVERRTNISVFTEMLTPKRVKELVAVTQDKRGNET